MRSEYERKRKALFIGIIYLMFILAGLALGLALAHRGDKSETISTTITVKQGDTLWSIAEENCPNQDPRKTIHQIKKDNAIKNFIYPGDKLVVPREVKPVQEAAQK